MRLLFIMNDPPSALFPYKPIHPFKILHYDLTLMLHNLSTGANKLKEIDETA